MNYKLVKNYLDEKNIKWKPMRDGSGIGMMELGAEKADMVVLGADTMESSRAHYFAEKYPERFLQLGITEQAMIGVASGLSYSGKVPFAVTYAPFLIGRPWEPIRTTVAYPNRHVVFVSSHAGISTGQDGPTHQMTEDISITRCLPNFTVICPADYEQSRLAVAAAYDLKGPVYIRNAREATPMFISPNSKFEVGKAEILREGKDITALGHGFVLYWLLLIAEELKDQIDIEVINLHTIKPIDREAIIKSAQKTKKVFTVEDHNIVGGMGSAVAEVLAENYPVPLYRHGVMDIFTESGAARDLWKKYKLDKEGIKEKLLEFYSNKDYFDSK